MDAQPHRDDRAPAPNVGRRRARAWLAAGLLACVAHAAMAGDGKGREYDGDHDHDRVREAVRAGDVMPLDALRAHLRRSHPGELLELELERDKGRWIYELKLLRPDGRIVKLEVDARSGEVLRERRR